MTDHSQISTWEYLGGFSFAIFFGGFILYFVGVILHWVFNGIDANTARQYTSYELILLPILIIIPFVIQLILFAYFFHISRKEKELSIFFKIYSWVMCFGLFSYSILWVVYNLIPTKYWSDTALSYFSVISLLVIGGLIWIILLCTRVVIRKNFVKSEGLLDSSDLTAQQYKALCNRLNLVLEIQDIEELSNDTPDIVKLKEILISPDNFLEEREKIAKAVTEFAPNLSPVRFPLTEHSPDIDKIIYVLIDREQPTQIKPLKRILYFLQDDKNIWIHNAITNKDFNSVSKHMLIKSLNKILMDPRFFDKAVFKSQNGNNTKVKAALEYFKNNKNPNSEYFIEKVQIENRKLFDAHILRFLNKNPEAIHESTQDNLPAEDRWFVSLIKGTGKVIFNCVLLGLNDHKELKIKEGIIRFPFSMLSFFLTIFICIVYLFAFAFAFHDRSILVSESEDTTPALFMANDYLIKNVNTNANSKSNTNVNTNSPADMNLNFNANPNMHANTKVVSDTITVGKPRIPRTLFIFYAPAAAGLEIEMPDYSEIASSEIELEKCDEFSTDFQKKLFEAKYTVNQKDEAQLQAFRSLANKVNFCYALQEVKHNAPTAKKIYIEIVGRANDASLNAPSKSDPNSSSKQTYSANFELSLARAQSLKFELVRQLQNTPDFLEKIEWSYLPVSNDQSLGSDYPLNSSINRPLIVNNNKLLTQEKQQEYLQRIKNEFAPEKICEPDEFKKNKFRDRVIGYKDRLLRHIDKVASLFKENKIKNLKAGEDLFISLQSERVSYEGIADEKKAGMKVGDNKYVTTEKELDEQQKLIEMALFYYDLDSDNANKRTSEIYITSIPETNEIIPIPRINLNLMDYILYSITKSGYADIKPTTLYAKFLSTLINIIEIFFLVVFFNALLSVKRVNEEDEAFNSA